ncbi:MAG: hypothetical protein ACLP22_02140 [Solirubrobacteraceae bacterium]
MSDTTQYLNDLDAELARAGIRGTRRKRIVTEFADHLSCAPDADLGEPTALATEFADELGTSFARTAAYQAFVALALAGILVVVRVLALLPLTANDFGTADTVSLLISALAAQVALVAGGLGLLRALRLRGRGTIPREEASVLARRAGIGLAAGVVTIIAFPLSQAYRAHTGAIMLGHSTNVCWPLASAAGVSMLVAATPAVVRAARLRPHTAGPAGDLLADLGPLQPVAARIASGSVNRLAFIIAAGLAIVMALAGVAANDPYDGVLRGLLEGGAFLGGYAVLGRYLGIRRESHTMCETGPEKADDRHPSASAHPPEPPFNSGDARRQPAPIAHARSGGAGRRSPRIAAQTPSA